MKVVVNRCFGGFRLSPAAYRRIAELQGKKCYFFTKDFKKDEWNELEDAKTTRFFIAFSIPNPNEVLGREDQWFAMTMEEKDAWNKRYEDAEIYDFRNDRTNPLLIQVVEELGQRASAAAAQLEIVEIPDGIEWEIDEYDGNETVEETHRKW
jgi:hypothetical protein